jgi:CRP/FNR family transcriptional regulator
MADKLKKPLSKAKIKIVIPELNGRETLRSLPLFSELSIDEMRRIFSISKVVKIKKNCYVFHEGDNYRGFFILLKGSVKVFRISSEGSEAVIHLIKRFDSFADAPMFEGGGVYLVNAQTMADSILILIPKIGFLKLLSTSPSMCLKILAGFSKRMRGLTRQVAALTTKDVPARFAEFLVEEIRKSGTDKLPEPFIKLNVPKKIIASYIGTISSTLSRTINKMQTGNIIRVSGKTIFILDFSRLKKMVQ